MIQIGPSTRSSLISETTVVAMALGLRLLQERFFVEQYEDFEQKEESLM